MINWVLRQYVDAREPSNSPININFFNVTTSSYDIQFQDSNYGDVVFPTGGWLLIRKTGSYSTTDPIDNVFYNVGDSLGDGIVAANAKRFSEFVGFIQVTETGLTTKTRYYYKVYPYNVLDSSINYKQSAPLQGNVITL